MRRQPHVAEGTHVSSELEKAMLFMTVVLSPKMEDTLIFSGAGTFATLFTELRRVDVTRTANTEKERSSPSSMG